MNTRKEKKFADFLKYLVKLDPEEWLGVARILGVQTGAKNPITNKAEPVGAEEIFSNIMDNFLLLTTRRQKNLLKIMREAVKKGVK